MSHPGTLQSGPHLCNPQHEPQFLPHPNSFSLTHILFSMVTDQLPQLKIPSNHSHL